MNTHSLLGAVLFVFMPILATVGGSGLAARASIRRDPEEVRTHS